MSRPVSLRSRVVRALVAGAGLALAVSTLSACDFDGAYDPPVGHEGHRLEYPRGHFAIDAA